MRTTALKIRVVVRIKEAILYRFIIIIFIMSLSACTVNKENSKYSFSDFFAPSQDEWLSLLPTEELKSRNRQSKSNSIGKETDDNERVEQLRKKAKELSAYEF